jgi:hypothetical protein
MYEYKFVKVDVHTFSSIPKDDYHVIIEKNARDGWRLNQIFFLPRVGGTVPFIELIFEKKKN